MSEEEKKAKEAADHEAKEEADTEFEASLDGLSDEEKAEKLAEKNKQVDNKIDYKAEAEKERKAREAAEQAIIKNKIKDKKDKKEDEGNDEDDDDDDKPMTKREAREMFAHQEKQNLAQSALQIAKSFASSPDEAELIVEKWRNRTFPAHLSLADQIEEAYAVTHSKKLIGERNEALRALKNKENVNSDGSGTHRDAPKGTDTKIAPDMLLAIKQSELVFNTTSRQYERKLADGSSLVYDQKQKQIVRIPKSQPSSHITNPKGVVNLYLQSNLTHIEMRLLAL